ncbi:hypothetical protein AB1Y20_002968 [Prymnesium parvum]|uniref:Coenzyme Q-binding protein COQ10 START domain-containing protein n=1 Tax=Prymnesium parvum TaxID=97485 RepID=A0AB34JAU7_PRYPA
MSRRFRAEVISMAVLLLPALAWAAANPNVPHIHNGIMDKYENVPPSKYGISVADVSLERLRSGRPVIKMISGKKGKRCVTIQDMNAPESVVWKVITDLPNYPKMVEGCEACDVYKTERKLGGGRVDYARYQVGAMGFKIEYFMQHNFEPSKHCFTFHLDYTRLSDLSDTVGYWYVEALDDGWCRVYYSTDSMLPGWIPGFAKDSLINLAAKRATGWVNKYCQITQGRATTTTGPLTKQRILLMATLGGIFHGKVVAALKKLSKIPRPIWLRQLLSLRSGTATG